MLNLYEAVRTTPSYNRLEIGEFLFAERDILSRKTNSANACIAVVAKAMEIAGGQGFYRGFGLERAFRDVQAAKYHPLPQADQQQSYGESLLNPPDGLATHTLAD